MILRVHRKLLLSCQFLILKKHLKWILHWRTFPRLMWVLLQCAIWGLCKPTKTQIWAPFKILKAATVSVVICYTCCVQLFILGVFVWNRRNPLGVTGFLHQFVLENVSWYKWKFRLSFIPLMFHCSWLPLPPSHISYIWLPFLSHRGSPRYVLQGWVKWEAKSGRSSLTS